MRDFFASAAAHPDEMIAKAQQELREVLQGICESIQYILFANDPAIIRTIDREISDFEKHLHSLKEKMPLFEKKLEKAQEHLTKTRQDLTLQLSLMEQKSSELEELFKKLDNESSELGLENFREFLGHQDLADKQQQFNAQLETMQDLANKIDLIMSGIRLVKQADNEEIKAIRRWNIYIGYTPLPALENAFLIACDMPHLSLKMFNEIVYNTPQRSDDLWSHLRRRVKLSEILPIGVEKFAQALILFKQARKNVLDCLTSLEVTTPLAKENWTEEREILEEGRRHFNEADLMFCEKLFPKHQIGKIAGSFRTQGERLKKISKEVEEIRETIDRFKKA